MEIVFLGTSAAVPTKKRNLTSTALIYKGKQILFDAGEDIQRQFESASLKFNAPLTIFISHMHGDHVIGLPGLLFHFSLILRETDIDIYGPPGLYAYLTIHKYTTGLKAPFLKNVYEILPNTHFLQKYDFQGDPNKKPEQIKIIDNILYEDEEFYIRFYEMSHSVLTYGFKFLEKPRPGKFNPNNAIKRGIPKGKLWKEMQMGIKIKYKNEIIDPLKEGIIGPKRPGLIISYSSDTEPCENLNNLAKDSDVFICESTYSSELKELAIEKKHMTSEMAAECASKNDVRKLVLTHISSRYNEEEDESALLMDAKKIFSNTIIAQDLMKLTPKRRS